MKNFWKLYLNFLKNLAANLLEPGLSIKDFLKLSKIEKSRPPKLSEEKPVKEVEVAEQFHFIPEEDNLFLSMHKFSEDCPCNPELLDKELGKNEKDVYVHHMIQ